MDVRLHVFALAPDPDHGSILAEDERARAARFVDPVLAARYCAGRAGLRRRLAAAVDWAPEALPLTTGPHGKPDFDRAALPHAPHFNLTHSGDWALLAIGPVPLGVDLEALAPLRGDVGRRTLSSAERAGLAAWADPAAGFLALWTAKEAVLKGLGVGLKAGLMSLEIAAPPDGPPRLLRLDAEPASLWRLAAAPAPTGFVAALAVRTGEPLVLRRLE